MGAEADGRYIWIVRSLACPYYTARVGSVGVAPRM